MNRKMSADDLYNSISKVSDKWVLMADDPIQIQNAVAETVSPKEQKRFVLYEIKKLCGVKYLWIFLAVLLMLNSIVAWYSADQTMAAQEPTQMISEFFAEYLENPSELDEYYAKMQAFNAEQEALYQKAQREDIYDFEKEIMPNLYSTDPDYSDEMLFARLYDTVEAVRDYPEVLENVIDRARANLEAFVQMGVTEDSFTYQYQLRVIELYELMLDNVEIKMEYTRGWNEYFAYDIVNIFIFAMLIILGSIVFVHEKQSGFMPIMRTTKNGRAKTAAAKIITMLILTTVITLMFTFSTFAVYGLRIGFSSPENVIQALPAFTLSPYQITIGEYFMITLGVKLLTFAVFAMIVGTLSVVVYNYIFIYLSGLGIFGVNFLFYTLTYMDPNNVFKNLNLVTTSVGNPLFERYRAMSLFGGVAGFVPIMFTLFTIIILTCAITTISLYMKGAGGIRIEWIDKSVAWCMTQIVKVRHAFPTRDRIKRRTIIKARAYNRSLVLAEVFKTLISSRFIVIVLLILCVKTVYSYNTNSPVKSYSDSIYKEYMTTLAGEITEEKLTYIAEERAMIADALSKALYMMEAYANEQITFEEYRDYLSDYNYANSHTDVLAVIEHHAEYLQEVEKETGVRGWFVYDTGWKKMYTEDADLFLYASILLLLTGSFAAEYVSKSSSGGFVQLLRTTKNGRHKTFSAKMISSVIIAVVLAMLTGIVDVIVIIAGYDLPSLDAPLVSIQMFSKMSGGITIAQYFVLFFIVRIVGAIILAMLVCSLSELLARYIPVLGVVVGLTLLPALCGYFGFAIAEKINFLNILAATPLFIQSAELAWFENGYSMLTLWITIMITAITFMVASAKRSFVK